MKESPVIALECNGLSKLFGGLYAVNDVSLRIEKGERRAIIGPNGAGKTTLFNLLSGELKPTTGEIKIFQKDVTDMPKHRRVALGLGRTFQITNLLSSSTLLENLLIAIMGLQKSKFSMFKPLVSYKRVLEEAMQMLELIGMTDKAEIPVKYLSHGEQRQVEIALTLIIKPKVLLLDEPTAGLSPGELLIMTDILHKLDPEITVLMIEHNMDVAFRIGEKITVLNQGRIFAEGDESEIRRNVSVQNIYFGKQ